MILIMIVIKQILDASSEPALGGGGGGGLC